MRVTTSEIWKNWTLPNVHACTHHLCTPLQQHLCYMKTFVALGKPFFLAPTTTTPLPPRTLPLSLRKVFLEKQWINIKQGTSEKNEPKLIQIIYKPLFPTTPCYLQSAVLQPDFSISESKARQKLIFSYKTGNWKVTIVHDERPRCIRRLINFKVYLKF